MRDKKEEKIEIIVQFTTNDYIDVWPQLSHLPYRHWIWLRQRQEQVGIESPQWW